MRFKINKIAPKLLTIKAPAPSISSPWVIVGLFSMTRTFSPYKLRFIEKNFRLHTKDL